MEIFEKFKWNIENFSQLKNVKIYSEPFVLGGYPWRINLYLQGNNVDDFISIFLEAVKTSNMCEGWCRHVKHKLTIFNQLDSDMNITRESNHQEFNERSFFRGYCDFMPLDYLHDPEEGFVVKDTCIIGAEVFVSKSTNETQVNQTAKINVSITSRSLTSHKEVEIPLQEPDVQDPNHVTCSPVTAMVCSGPTKLTESELFSPTIGELMDFSSVVEHQEEICFPSLIERSLKRSRTFTDLAFSALGRVLYFLKTRKVKDMNDQACKDLQILWEELEKFRFYLAWLEPHVQSALGTKSYVSKAVEVENLNQNVVALELEIERQKAKLAAAKVNFNIERDLLIGKGFEERDLDCELLECGS